MSEWERFAGEIGWPIVTRDKIVVGHPGAAYVVYDAINKKIVRLSAYPPAVPGVGQRGVAVEMSAEEARRLAAELVFAADRVDNGGRDEDRDSRDHRKDER